MSCCCCVYVVLCRGHSHMSVDIRCLSIDPHFLRQSYTQWPPFFFSPHPMTPFFPLLYQSSHVQITNFHAYFRNLQILLYYNINFANFGLKLHFCTLNDPHFGGPHQKNPFFFFFFFWAHTEWPPFFNEILHRMPPTFFSPVGTCTPLSYSGVPLGLCMTEWHVWFKSFKSVTWLYCGTIMGLIFMKWMFIVWFFLLMFLFVFVLNLWHAFFNTKFMCNHALCLLSVSLAFSVHVTQ